VGEIGGDVRLELKMSMRMKEMVRIRKTKHLKLGRVDIDDLGVKEDMRGTEGVGMV
jgi:hypothetical protein